MNRPRAVIFDLDGTVSDCSPRNHLVDGPEKDWEAFADLCTEDKPIDWAVEMIRVLASSGYTILFVTARTSRVRDQTELWISRHIGAGISYRLYMRAAGDWRAPALIKKDLFFDAVSPNFHVLLAVDDSPEVVGMWRKIGLPCLQCAEAQY